MNMHHEYYYNGIYFYVSHEYAIIKEKYTMACVLFQNVPIQSMFCALPEYGIS